MPVPRLVLLVTILVSLLALAACGGADEDQPLYLRDSEDATPTGTPAPDADGDAVPDATDACPDTAERTGGLDFESPDGCPDSLAELVAFAAADIDDYWATRLRGIAVGYVAPELIPYREAVPTGCGPAPLDNAIYCGFDHTVYYDEALFEREFEVNGDFAPILILAHEWGHVVQAHIGFFALENLYDIDYELQADCMAGVYARNLNQRKLLALGDLDEAGATLLNIGDDAGEVAWYDPGAHGTGEERTYAFQTGFEDGLSICANVADAARER
ncbi:MAG: neutral zinc metallopeptidase [Dehalococcoidia bacterium]